MQNKPPQPPNAWGPPPPPPSQQQQQQTHTWSTPIPDNQRVKLSWTDPSQSDSDTLPSWEPPTSTRSQPPQPQQPQPPAPPSSSGWEDKGSNSSSKNSSKWTQPQPEVGKHPGVTCDACGATDIQGIRHKCHYCFNYDLCDKCFRAQAVSKTHKASHPMEDLAPGQRPGKTRPQRESPVGKYVRRGRDWKWGEQDGRDRGTCVGLKGQAAVVRWAKGGRNTYRWGIDDAYDVFIDGIAEAKDLVGCVVRRGPDWKWDDQDAGGEGVIEAQPEPGIALVRWRKTGTAFQYRWGMEGAYDLLVISEKDEEQQQQQQQQKQRAGGSGSSGSSGGGVELDEENAVKLMFLCVGGLKLNLKEGVLKTEPDVSMASSLRDTYVKVFALEQAIKFPFFTEAWRSYKYEYWFKEMNSPTVTLPHIATCLIELEMNILPTAQTEEWKEVRKDWLRLLQIVGGGLLEYPAQGGAAANQGTSGKRQERASGTRRDVDDAMSRCKLQ